jgi:hypothetical protein
MQRNRTKPNRLTAKQKQAAALLANGKRSGEVAQQLNVSRSTLWAWQKKPAFQALYNRELVDLVEAIGDEVRCSQLEAMRLLRETMQDTNADLRWRIESAKLILSQLPPPAPKEAGSTDPVEIQEQTAWQEKMDAELASMDIFGSTGL